MTPEQERDLKWVKGRQDETHAMVGEILARLNPPGAAPAPPGPHAYTPTESFDVERVYAAFKTRLLDELRSDPAEAAVLLEAVESRPQLVVRIDRPRLEVSEKTLRGRVAVLLGAGFFDKARTTADAAIELKARGWDDSALHIGNTLKQLAREGFVTTSGKWFTAVPGTRDRIDLNTTPDVEAPTVVAGRGKR